MTVITSTEFSRHRGKYLGLAASGQDVILRSRDHGNFKLAPVEEDPTLMTQEQFRAQIDRGYEQMRQGECIAMKPNESVEDFVNRLLCTR